MSNKLMKIMAIAVSIIVLGSGFTFATVPINSAIPSDVAGSTYEEAVKALVEKNIITGDTDGLYHPNSNLTRAQACIIVVKSMNPLSAEVLGTATQSVQKSGFKDMSGYSWAEGYITYAVKNGVVTGYPDGTFKPGSKVTMNELIAMVLRAADFRDTNIGGTWPSNYILKATELNLLNNIPSPLPNLATKGIAAQFNYNALDKIEKANPISDNSEQGSDQRNSNLLPDTTSMIYTNGNFNGTMSSYSGKEISNNVIVYSYGLAKDYNSTMTFTKRIADYRVDTIYKYKNVKTPSFISVVNDKITEMVLPMDVGFSGRAYSVINDTNTSSNYNKESVTGLETLTATREITWLCKKGFTQTIPPSPDYLLGEVYELNLSNGEIQSIYKSSEAGKKGSEFNEISSTGAIFVTIEKNENGVVKIEAADGGASFIVNDNATVYVLDLNDPTEYKAGRISAIKAGREIRAFDISDDDDPSADIIVLKY